MILEELHKIQAAWRQHHLKRESEVVLGKMLQPEPKRESDTEEYYLRSANIQWSGVEVSDVKTMWFSPEEKRQLNLIKGDLLVSEGGDVGRCCVWNDEITPCFFQNAINRIRPRRASSSQFLFYWLSNLKNSGFIDAAVAKITIAHLTAVKLERMPVPLVPIDEQKRIAVYLDASCAAIDRAIETKQKQLDTLDALRKSTIQLAVTQGLNPKVKMKDSGIHWVPRVPNHWRTTRIKRDINLVRGQFTPRPRSDPRFYGGPYPFIQTGSISATEKYITEYKQTLNEEGLLVSRMFPAGTIVMTITGAKIGEVAMTTFDACFPDSVVGFMPNHHVDNEFLFYVLVAMKPAFLQSIIVTTQPNINYVQLGNHFVTLPEIAEQKEIVATLEASLEKLNNLRGNLGAQITTLTAYRKSLIHECVTGKRRITDADFAKVGAHV